MVWRTEAVARPASMSSLAARLVMLSMQPQSAVTTCLAPVALSEATLSLTIAVEISGCFSEKLPPKPQHSDSWS